MSAAAKIPLRRKAYLQLDVRAWSGSGLSPINRTIALLIVSSVVVVVLESEPTISGEAPSTFDAIDSLIAIVFAVEYLARLWVAPENPAYRGPFGRLRYALTIPALVDLAAFLPYFLFAGLNDAFLIRIIRLLRLLALAKYGRLSLALRHIQRALYDRRFELVAAAAIAATILLVSATLMYVIEGALQPEAFGSIPRALWWSVSTLTTVGYGDVYPRSPLGKVLGGVTSLAAIGVIVLPTGILAAAFGDAFRRHAEESRDQSTKRSDLEKQDNDETN